MRRLTLIAVAAVLAGAVCVAQSKRVNVTFAPQNKDQQFDAATDEVRRRAESQSVTWGNRDGIRPAQVRLAWARARLARTIE